MMSDQYAGITRETVMSLDRELLSGELRIEQSPARELRGRPSNWIQCKPQHRFRKAQLEARRVRTSNDLEDLRKPVVVPRRETAVPNRERRLEQNPVLTVADHLAERIDVRRHNGHTLRQRFQNDHTE